MRNHHLNALNLPHQPPNRSNRAFSSLRINMHTPQPPTPITVHRDPLLPLQNPHIMTTVPTKINPPPLSDPRKQIDMSEKVAWSIANIHRPVPEIVQNM